MIVSKDHVERGLTRLLTTLKRTQVEAFLAALLVQAQKVEDMAAEVAAYSNVESGFGVMLDWLGRIVGRGRDTYTDAQYRIGIRAQVRVNRAIGNDADITDVATLALPSVTFVVRSFPPKTTIIEATSALSEAEAAPMKDNFRQSRALGTRMHLMWSPEPRETQFICDDVNDPTVGALQGCGDTADASAGGRLQTVDPLT